MHPPRALPPRSRQQGAALLLLALILLIGGMTFFFSRVGDNPSVGRDKISQDALEQARQALIGYAATYRDTHVGEMFGYLPCPDTNNDGAAEAACGNAGEDLLPDRSFRPQRVDAARLAGDGSPAPRRQLADLRALAVAVL